MSRRALWIVRHHLPGGTVALILSIVITITACGSDAEKSASASDATSLPPGVVELSVDAQRTGGVQVTPSVRRALPTTLELTGSVTPIDSRVAHIRPLAEGVVERVSVTYGQRVREGDPLLDYDNIELGERVGEFMVQLAAVRKAESDLDVRRRTLERADALIQIEGISQQELELRRAEFQNAQAGVASERARLDRVEEQLHRFGLSEADVAKLRTTERSLAGSELDATDTDWRARVEEVTADRAGHRSASHNTIRAPFAGAVTKYEVAPGELVDPSKELMTITDLSRVWVLADVYEQDIAKLAPRRAVTLSADAYPGRTFTGQLTYISDAIDPQTRTAKVRCVVDNADGSLKLDMFVRVTIPTGDARQSVVVPTAAVQQVDGQPVVFVRRSSTTFERRDVQTGATAGDVMEIVSGLEPGVAVVGTGSFYLKTALLRERVGEGD
jgi:cobalt-zinc-cadmium efflux system membrane fusion protein